MKVIFEDKFNKSKQYDLDHIGGILPQKGDNIVWENESYHKVTEIVWDIENQFIFIAVD